MLAVGAVTHDGRGRQRRVVGISAEHRSWTAASSGRDLRRAPILDGSVECPESQPKSGWEGRIAVTAK
jgi:hypothetical protein